MVYIEYERLKKQYEFMQGICDQILREKERYFTKTQPNAIRYDRLNVKGGAKDNSFDEYLDDCDRHKIDQRLDEAIKTLRARAELVAIKEEQLRKSKELENIVYTMKFIDNAKTKTIAMALGYSESQVYRLIQKIQERIAR